MMLSARWPAAVLAAFAEPVTVDPAAVMREIRAAYAERPTAERIELKLEGDRIPSRTEPYTVRIDPGSGGAPDDRPGGDARASTALLELGVLRVRLGGTGTLAWLEAAGGAYCESSAPGTAWELLRTGAAPPLLVPQAELASCRSGHQAESEAGWEGLRPYVSDVRWTGASTDPAEARPVFRLRGRGSEGEVEVIADAATGRLTGWTIRLDEPRAILTAVVFVLKPDVGLMGELDRQGRERVGDLTELSRRAARHAIGSAVGELPLLTPSRESWDWERAFSHSEGGPTHLMLVLHRRDGGDAEQASARREAELLEHACREVARAARAAGEAARIVIRCAGVYELGADRLMERVAKDAKERGGEYLWAVSPGATIDRFAPGARAVAVVIDSAGVLRAVEIAGADPLDRDAAVARLSGSIRRP
ncbi:MAG: hypothetical protein JNM07_11655 [Phycisphaerae bacterium]|nr:hypothetical protein [Phycisphaerae bacterium]